MLCGITKTAAEETGTQGNKCTIILLDFVCVALQLEVSPESRLVEVDESVAR